MILPTAPGRYDSIEEARLRKQLELADAENHKKQRDLSLGQGRLILTSPDGTRWSVSVSNAGVVSTSVVV